MLTESPSRGQTSLEARSSHIISIPGSSRMDPGGSTIGYIWGGGSNLRSLEPLRAASCHSTTNVGLGIILLMAKELLLSSSILIYDQITFDNIPTWDNNSVNNFIHNTHIYIVNLWSNRNEITKYNIYWITSHLYFDVKDMLLFFKYGKGIR